MGSSDFVERVLKEADEQLEEKYRLHVQAVYLQAPIEKVANLYRIDPKDLKSAGKERRVTTARRILCYIAALKLGYSCTYVSKEMGISSVTASKAIGLGSKISDIEKRIVGIAVAHKQVYKYINRTDIPFGPGEK